MVNLKQVQIEPTNICNLDCNMCPRKFMKDELGMMSIELFEKTIEKLDTKTKLIMHFRGEPLLNKDFGRMLRLATEYGFKDIIFSTNATKLYNDVLYDIFESNVTSISYSFHFNNDADVNFDQFLRMNKSFNNKIKTQVSITENEINRLHDAKLYIPNNKTEFIFNYKDRVDRIRIYPTHSIDGNFGHVNGLKKYERKQCKLPFESTVVCWDGSVHLCCQDWNGYSYLGNISIKSINDIFNNDFYQKERNFQHNFNFPDDHVCKTCSQWKQYCKDSKVVGELIMGDTL